MQLEDIAIRIFRELQLAAPFDSGNLAFNAMDLQMYPNEIKFIYNFNGAAEYTEYLEEGTANSGEHVGFISQDAVYMVSKMAHDWYNQTLSNESFQFESFMKKAQSNPARQERFLQQIAK